MSDFPRDALLALIASTVVCSSSSLAAEPPTASSSQSAATSGASVTSEPSEVRLPVLLSGRRPDDSRPKYLAPGDRTAIAVVRYTVGKDGRTSDISVVKSTHDFWADRVAAAVATWRYEIPMRDGKPVSIRLEQEIKVKFDY
jgi:TonB family protein